MESVLSTVAYVVPAIAVIWYLIAGLHITNQWERKPLKRWGQYVRTLGPGITWAEPISSRVIDTIEMQVQVDNVYSELGLKELPPLQTRDNVPISFQLILTWRVVDAAKFVLVVQDGHDAVYQRTSTKVSDYISQTPLDAILHERQLAYAGILSALRPVVAEWGAEVDAIEMKEFFISNEQIREGLSLKARAQKEAEAELMRAEMQTQIAIKLKEAADVYDAESWKLKGFETLLELCRSANNNTVMIPTDLVQGIAKVLTK